MKYLYLFLLITVFFTNLISQNSFDFRISNDNSEIPLSLYEKPNGQFLLIAFRMPNMGGKSSVLLTSFSNPEDTSSVVISKADTAIGIHFVTQKANGNFFFIGGWYISDSISGLYLWETTSELITEYEVYYDLPNPYTSLEVLDYTIDNENNVVISGRAYYYSGTQYSTHLYICKVNLSGLLLNQNIVAPYIGDVTSTLLVIPDNSGYFLMGHSLINFISKDWLKFDNELNLIDEGNLDWESGLSGLSALFLPNGNLFVERQKNSHEQIALFNEDFVMLKDTFLLEGDDYSPFQYNSTAYTDPENIWVASHNSDPFWMAGSNLYHVFLYDSQLNLKGLKYYGGDTRYFMLDLIATSDGGCLMAGVVADVVGNTTTDIVIRKVMPNDLITHAEDTPVPDDRDVNIYPVPFDEKLVVKSVRKGLLFNLLSVTGEIYISSEITPNVKKTLLVSHFKSGFYFYTITENNHIIQSGKLIKK